MDGWYRFPSYNKLFKNCGRNGITNPIYEKGMVTIDRVMEGLTEWETFEFLELIYHLKIMENPAKHSDNNPGHWSS